MISGSGGNFDNFILHGNDLEYSVVHKKVTVLLSSGLAWPARAGCNWLDFSRNLAPTFLHNPVA